MLQLTPQTRILLATEPVDFRKGIDGLAAVCRRVLLEQPLSGTVFVFRNRAGTALKLLCYDGQGFWLSRTVHNAFLSAEDGGDALSAHDLDTAPGAHAPEERCD
jgi:transposase